MLVLALLAGDAVERDHGRCSPHRPRRAPSVRLMPSREEKLGVPGCTDRRYCKETSETTSSTSNGTTHQPVNQNHEQIPIRMDRSVNPWPSQKHLRCAPSLVNSEDSSSAAPPIQLGILLCPGVMKVLFISQT